MAVTYIVPPTPPDTTTLEFEGQCKILCSNFQTEGTPEAATKFCQYSVMNYDWNGNSLSDSFDASTLLLPICEDEVYCFQIHNCKKRDNQFMSWEDCKNSMCQAYEKAYPELDISSLNQKVLSVIKPGTCGLPKDIAENWFLKFFGDKPCG